MPRALIVGGGPAGASAAVHLANAGVDTLILERSEGVRSIVCGGFLGGDAIAALDRLGVSCFGLGAHRIQHLRVVANGRIREARLPFPAAGMSRALLDEALLAHAQEAGASVMRGAKVKSVDLATKTATLANGAHVAGEALFLATGKHALRGAHRHSAGKHKGAVGLRTSFAPSPGTWLALSGFVELHPFDKGYVGLLLTEDGQVNLCLSTTPDRLRSAGSPDALLEELINDNSVLADRTKNAATNWSAISGVEYGWRAREGIGGIFRVGDQAAVISSLVGDGIAIALTSGARAAHALLEGGGEAAARFQRDFSKEALRPVAVAGMLRHAAEHRKLRPAMFAMMGLGNWTSALAARLTRIA